MRERGKREEDMREREEGRGYEREREERRKCMCVCMCVKERREGRVKIREWGEGRERLDVAHMSFLHVVMCYLQFILCITMQSSLAEIQPGVFIHITLEGHLRCFQFLTITNITAV